MDSKDVLQEIPDEKLPELLTILKQTYPECIQVYNFVDTTIKIKKRRPEENYVQIYAPFGDFSDGTILATIDMHCYDILIYTQDKTLKKLEIILRESKIIQWERNPLFCAMHQDYLEMVTRVRNEIGHPFPTDIPSHIWWLPKELALKYEYSLPEDLYVKNLSEDHAIIMNDVWPHKSPGTEKYLAKLIELNGGIGLFHKSTNELCAWVLTNYFGGLGMLQVAEKYKRKGYGSLITKIYSKIIAQETGLDISGFIVRKNFASQNMFKKLGFKQLTPVTWLVNYQYLL